METMTKERRRFIKRFVVNGSGSEELRIEELMNNLRQEVQVVREEQPELSDYQLYDLTFSFHENGMMVQMEFRR